MDIFSHFPVVFYHKGESNSRNNKKKPLKKQWKQVNNNLPNW